MLRFQIPGKNILPLLPLNCTWLWHLIIFHTAKRCAPCLIDCLDGTILFYHFFPKICCSILSVKPQTCRLIVWIFQIASLCPCRRIQRFSCRSHIHHQRIYGVKKTFFFINLQLAVYGIFGILINTVIPIADGVDWLHSIGIHQRRVRFHRHPALGHHDRGRNQLQAKSGIHSGTQCILRLSWHDPIALAQGSPRSLIAHGFHTKRHIIRTPLLDCFLCPVHKLAFCKAKS